MRTLTNALGSLVPALALALAPCSPATTVVVGQSLGGGGGGATYLLEEDWEGTGTPSGWSDTFGTPDHDDTSTGSSPLMGSESLYLASGEKTRTVSFSASGDCYAYFVAEFGAASGSSTIFEMEGSGSTFRCRVEFRPGGFLRLYHGSSSADGSTVVSSSVKHIWVEYEVGTGSDGVARLYYSASAGTKTLEATVTTGTATDDIIQFELVGPTNGVLMDTLRGSATAIGTNPS